MLQIVLAVFAGVVIGLAVATYFAARWIVKVIEGVSNR